MIRGRVGDLVDKHALSLPDLEPLLTSSEGEEWFPVPGMAGGFAYRLEGEGSSAKLIVSSWSRVVEGSGARHEISAEGSRLVETGFV